VVVVVQRGCSQPSTPPRLRLAPVLSFFGAVTVSGFLLDRDYVHVFSRADALFVHFCRDFSSRSRFCSLFVCFFMRSSFLAAILLYSSNWRRSSFPVAFFRFALYTTAVLFGFSKVVRIWIIKTRLVFLLVFVCEAQELKMG
jgi:ABC-type multidrug transport system permease subunit